MTKKKEKKEDKDKEQGQSKSSVKSQIPEKSAESKSIEQTKSEDSTSEEVKLIEAKEGATLKLLDYFSKEVLIKKVKELEETIKKQDEKIKTLENEPWKVKYIHLQAEFENAQKRWDKSRKDLRTQYNAYVLKSFLPLYDSFQKAMESDTESESIKQFFNQFMNILKSYGAEPMQTKLNDSYDYNLHEALTSIEKEDLDENRVCEVIQEGWKLNKDVLRYAKVVISKKPKPPEPEPEKEGVKTEEEKPEETEIKEESSKDEEV